MPIEPCVFGKKVKVTSVSSYSELIDYIQWGYNREEETLAQINLLMLASEESHLPMYYRIMAGSIKDVSALRESLANLELLDSHEHYITVGEDELYAASKCTRWKGHRCYIHTYYDSLKAELENKKFTHKLLQCYEELAGCNEKTENENFMPNISL